MKSTSLVASRFGFEVFAVVPISMSSPSSQTTLDARFGTKPQPGHSATETGIRHWHAGHSIGAAACLSLRFAAADCGLPGFSAACCMSVTNPSRRCESLWSRIVAKSFPGAVRSARPMICVNRISDLVGRARNQAPDVEIDARGHRSDADDHFDVAMLELLGDCEPFLAVRVGVDRRRSSC